MDNSHDSNKPVAWVHIQGRHKELSHLPLDDGEISRGWEQYPLYTSPPASKPWVGLTDEEVINVMPDDDTPISLGEAFSKFADLIEAKLREKNAQPSKPLTDEQIDRLYASCKYGSVPELARAIEAKLREKNGGGV